MIPSAVYLHRTRDAIAAHQRTARAQAARWVVAELRAELQARGVFAGKETVLKRNPSAAVRIPVAPLVSVLNVAGQSPCSRADRQPHETGQ